MTSNNRKPSITLVDVTPALAEQLLGRNDRNRNIRSATVAAYARDMAAGNWLMTGEPIKVAPNGALIDGQHRLLAVIKSGVTVQMVIARGIPAESQRVMDTGDKRSAADMLKMDGHANASNLAASVRFAMALESEKPKESRNQSGKVTNSEVADFLAQNQDLEAAVAATLHYRNTIDMPPSITAVAWWTLVRLDSEACETFFASIANNQTNGVGDPRNTLIQRLTSARKANERLPQTGQYSMLFRAWNAWVKGETLSKLPIYSTRDGGLVPIPNPVAP